MCLAKVQISCNVGVSLDPKFLQTDHWRYTCKHSAVVLLLKSRDLLLQPCQSMLMLIVSDGSLSAMPTVEGCWGGDSVASVVEVASVHSIDEIWYAYSLLFFSQLKHVYHNHPFVSVTQCLLSVCNCVGEEWDIQLPGYSLTVYIGHSSHHSPFPFLAHAVHIMSGDNTSKQMWQYYTGLDWGAKNASFHYNADFCIGRSGL